MHSWSGGTRTASYTPTGASSGGRSYGGFSGGGRSGGGSFGGGHR